MGKNPWPAKIDMVEKHMAWLIESGRPGSIKGAWTGITFAQGDKKFKKLDKSLTVRKLERAAEKIMAEKGMKPRDALLSDMVRSFCERMDRHLREDVLGCAVLTTGMRGLLRAGEISALKFKHLSNVTERFFTIDFGTRKNQTRGAAKIFIEASGNVTCPVKCMRRWLTWRRREGPCNPEDYVFTTHTGKNTQVSYAIVKDFVVRAAEEAGYYGLKLSGHSIRIGGATEAMIGGMSIAQIMVLGDWKSEAFARYLRGVEPAAAGATRLMGL